MLKNGPSVLVAVSHHFYPLLSKCLIADCSRWSTYTEVILLTWQVELFQKRVIDAFCVHYFVVGETCNLKVWKLLLEDKNI